MNGSTYTGVLGAVAECRDCGWTTEARNAMGNGARHAKRTGHNVWVEQTIGVSYNDPRGGQPEGAVRSSGARRREP